MLGKFFIDHASALSSWSDTLRRLTDQQYKAIYWKAEYDSLIETHQDYIVESSIELLEKDELIKALRDKNFELEQEVASQGLLTREDRSSGQEQIDFTNVQEVVEMEGSEPIII